MALLTHHQILAAAAPFVRAGFGVDLAGSDRADGRIALRGPAEVALQRLARGGWQAERRAAGARGLVARVVAEGADTADLATRLARVDPATQFEHGEGWDIAWSLRVPGGDAPPRLFAAALRVDGLTLEMSVSSVDGIAAELALAAPDGDIAELPADLLAVLGLRWARLDRTAAGWRSSLVLRGRGAARGDEARARLREAAAHLARTMAEPPARFHDRRVAARWGVTLRRAVPLLACVGVILAALAVPALDLSPDSVWRMLIFNAPPLMLGLFVVLREMPRVEIPPLPRRPSAPQWRKSPSA